MISRGHRGFDPDDAHGHEFCREGKPAWFWNSRKSFTNAACFMSFDPGGRVAPYIPAYSAQATESRNGLVVTPAKMVLLLRGWLGTLCSGGPRTIGSIVRLLLFQKFVNPNHDGPGRIVFDCGTLPQVIAIGELTHAIHPWPCTRPSSWRNDFFVIPSQPMAICPKLPFAPRGPSVFDLQRPAASPRCDTSTSDHHSGRP